jgi:hypothetical protein
LRLRTKLRRRSGRRGRNLRLLATGHLAAAAAVCRVGNRRSHHLPQQQEQAANDGQREFHSSVIVRPARLRQPKNVFIASLFVGFVSGADFDDELAWIFVEILFAGFATQFYFLTLIGEDERLAHVAIEFFTGDGAGLEQIRRGLGVFGAQRKVGGKNDSGNKREYFHTF